MKFFSLILLIFIPVFSQVVLSQESIPGKGMLMEHGYIEYIPGNLPLVISVPHGGYEKPDDIPERMGHYAKNQDIYTIEIARRIIEKSKELTGMYPYVIINHLHRTRLDANRNIEEAAAGNPVAGGVWYAYHEQIDKAKTEVTGKFGKGLYIDLHGHRHTLERIELGYLLSGDELRLEKELLDEGLLNEYSSIKYLLENNSMGLSLTELVRGDLSLGALLRDKGQVCVPDGNTPYPNPGEPFFSGGYNLNRYGSSSGGTIDGIQIEVGLQTRNDESLREKAADDIALSLIEFLSIHYFPQMAELAAYGKPFLEKHYGE